jgi:transposase
MIDANILVQTEESDLLRDVHSKALLNKNVAGLREYKAKKEFLEKVKKEDSETKIKLAILEKEMSEIKEILKEIASLRKV